MNKKRVLSFLLLAVLLIGCGKQDAGKQSDKSKEIEAAVDGQDAVSTEQLEPEIRIDSGSGLAQDKEETEADITEKGESSTATETDAAEAGTDKVGITAFGNVETMNHEVNGRELPIYCVDREDKKVALSFDAAWGNEDTANILDILKMHDVHVTFFMTGGWVESYPDDVKAILAAGHDLGNHSENHKNMSQLSDEEKKEELMAVHRKVKEITGYEMFLFRPPYGDYDNAVIDVAKECRYYAIQWDVDSLDWKNEGVDAIIQTVTTHKNLGNGSIILCHNGSEYIVQALDTLLTTLENDGYEIVPVSELLYQDGYHLNFKGRQILE